MVTVMSSVFVSLMPCTVIQSMIIFNNEVFNCNDVDATAVRPTLQPRISIYQYRPVGLHDYSLSVPRAQRATTPKLF